MLENFLKKGMKEFESLSSTLSIPSLVGLVRGLCLELENDQMYHLDLP